jgi:hypothetical protein
MMAANFRCWYTLVEHHQPEAPTRGKVFPRWRFGLVFELKPHPRACKSGPATEAIQSGPPQANRAGTGLGLPFAMANLAAIASFLPPEFATSLARFLRAHAVRLPL